MHAGSLESVLFISIHCPSDFFSRHAEKLPEGGDLDDHKS